MNKYQIKIIVSIVILINLSIMNRSYCQSTETQKNDSLTLSQVIKDVIENYPSIKEAEEAINFADAKIGLAKAGLLSRY